MLSPTPLELLNSTEINLIILFKFLDHFMQLTNLCVQFHYFIMMAWILIID